ncbi:Rad52/22 family double-strand break repair protein-domain-containing protein [Tribonema minus]|uniref:Rad52/22 family double-strand break repair protein-domain-containing protein n=1 Tax=Tribonema minus TaxID=303371 RepID=A0A835Z0H3_9STRA|nr:Rad52/22 family double-strand break repair protein-domain-containing protein [Tribonema minus]
MANWQAPSELCSVVKSEMPEDSAQGLRPASPGAEMRVQQMLQQSLCKEQIAQRSGPGGAKITYMPIEKAVELANDIFGYNGWSSTVVRMERDYELNCIRNGSHQVFKANHIARMELLGCAFGLQRRIINLHFSASKVCEQSKWEISYTAQVRVTLPSGTYHEDIGCGKGISRQRHLSPETTPKRFSNTLSSSLLPLLAVLSSYDAVDTAKKSASSDGLKRALRLFGNQLGNNLRDKSILKTSRATQQDTAGAPAHDGDSGGGGDDSFSQMGPDELAQLCNMSDSRIVARRLEERSGGGGGSGGGGSAKRQRC